MPCDHAQLLASLPTASSRAICERCGFFETGPEFIPILRRQVNHAADNGDAGRANLFEGILSDVADEGESSSFS